MRGAYFGTWVSCAIKHANDYTSLLLIIRTHDLHEYIWLGVCLELYEVLNSSRTPYAVTTDIIYNCAVFLTQWQFNLVGDKSGEKRLELMEGRESYLGNIIFQSTLESTQTTLAVP